MKSPADGLSVDERRRLSEDIYYLNIAELRGFCDQHGIPYRIHIVTADGRFASTRDLDRKGVIIDRILHFLKTGTIKPKTIFGTSVIATEPLDRTPIETDRVLYRRYKNHEPQILELMKRLTGGKFEFGAVAQEVLRACWSRDQAPTYRVFAELWQQAIKEHDRPNREWAFVTDRAEGRADNNWKKMRSARASVVLAILQKMGPGLRNQP